MANDTKGEVRVIAIKEEINRQLGDAETLKSLLDTTFKGLDGPVMKRALMEGMLRGFDFTEFLNGDVYAIPFGQGYSLVTSIDRSRKIGARSGIVGVEKPVYEMSEDGKLLACSMTVKKRFSDGYVGDFTAEVDFSEYSTGRNLWSSKPKTMISKVAEMHALRKACPEELANSYVEEEMQTTSSAPVSATVIDLDAFRLQIRDCKTKEELERVWADIPGSAKVELRSDMEEVKAMIISESKDIV